MICTGNFELILSIIIQNRNQEKKKGLQPVKIAALIYAYQILKETQSCSTRNQSSLQKKAGILIPAFYELKTCGLGAYGNQSP